MHHRLRNAFIERIIPVQHPQRPCPQVEYDPPEKQHLEIPARRREPRNQIAQKDEVLRVRHLEGSFPSGPHAASRVLWQHSNDSGRRHSRKQPRSLSSCLLLNNCWFPPKQISFERAHHRGAETEHQREGWLRRGYRQVPEKLRALLRNPWLPQQTQNHPCSQSQNGWLDDRGFDQFPLRRLNLLSRHQPPR